jgi:hypothetical protein
LEQNINNRIFMACDTPFDAFRLATEDLPDEIYKRASFRGLWLNLIRREVYPKNIGLTRSTFTLGRSEPTTDEPAFELISLDDGENYTGSCTTTYNDVSVGFDEHTYSPEQFGLKGPVICQDDLIYNFKAERFLEGYIKAITKYAERIIQNRYQAIYSHYVPKAVANTDFDFGNAVFSQPSTSPDLTLDESLCELTQEMLDQTAIELNEEGASDGNTDGWINLGDEGPIYPLYIGQWMSKRLLLNNSELREDYRQGSQNNELLKRMGASRVIGNFRHVINLFPPRYTYDDQTGSYTRVPTWVMNAGTKGFVADVNPDWRVAPFEACYVLSPEVWTDEIVKPVNSAAGISFPAKSYMGEWQFVVGGDEISTTKCFDPLKKLGAHFAEYKHAPRPVFPQYGRMIIFKRCPLNTFECVTCTS